MPQSIQLKPEQPVLVANFVVDKTNAVEELLDRIKKIQNGCEHDFLRPHDINLFCTLVRNAFRPQNFMMQCAKCNITKGVNTASVCPKCLSNMRDGGLGDSEKYFGRPSPLCKARFVFCTSCDITIVWEEIDQ